MRHATLLLVLAACHFHAATAADMLLPLGPWYEAFQWVDGHRSRVVPLPP
eukprot:CAMPEP_0202884460 /NCGR_PEP_ID=MMETSP1391-20130828/41003_1 /ASSEMBLY_ACC=CAM_ASM_000867 /TAXON_ID=1034604 /ORGANISM="Chlamydomonas leiostraca, Strain SAG 11-49" /LENGTH=49 /DNA_ID= /DNA_START= /DNA_END= /DNA_ORIENTATION=